MAALPQLVTDPVASAAAAGLRYVTDALPGIRRKRRGGHFAYVNPDGKPIRDRAELARIRALAVPPAYEDVWICPNPNGHLQATGRDARGRKQYRYHKRWREVRDETKYGRMLAFARALPELRTRIQADLELAGLPRRKVLATVVRLLETTLIRVGNEEYARDNKSFGLTTMRDRHVKIDGSTLRFAFRGKSGIQHSIDLEDRRLATIVKRCRDIPGQELFQFIDDDGARQSIDSADVNDYLREISGEDFTAKDFRTWNGTVFCALALQAFEASGSTTQSKKNVAEAVKSVARRLGNTPAVCRKCYVHPEIVDAYLEAGTLDVFRRRASKRAHEKPGMLRPEEAAVLRFLERRMALDQRDRTASLMRASIRRAVKTSKKPA